MMNVSQRRPPLFTRRDPGHGDTTIKTLKKEEADESKWRFVPAKVSGFFTLLFFFFVLVTNWNVFFFFFFCKDSK